MTGTCINDLCHKSVYTILIRRASNSTENGAVPVPVSGESKDERSEPFGRAQLEIGRTALEKPVEEGCVLDDSVSHLSKLF